MPRIEGNVFACILIVILAFITDCHAISNAESPSEDRATNSSDPEMSGSLTNDKESPSASTTSTVNLLTTRQTGSEEFKKVCRGTDSGFAHVSDVAEQYNIYKTMYTNCTHVDGNLEIVFLGNYTNDLNFLQNIREINGYVLIIATYVEYIPLTNLRVIRGRSLFEINKKYYSLYVALNHDYIEPTIGLRELRLSLLHEILVGSVFLFRNLNLCYADSIIWKDIVTGEGAEIYINGTNTICSQCDERCLFEGDGKRHCWGAGPLYCQDMTRVSCSPQCDGRCFGRLPNQCCHQECAGGCTGPTKSQCWACKNFDNEGMCENFCPPEFIYSRQEYRQVPNPKVKYSYGSLCVDKCPPHLIVDKGACVQDCGAGRMSGKEGKCIDCEGPCPKTCQIKYDERSDFIHNKNLQNFTGCTIIQGSIKILENTFIGDQYYKTGTMRPSQLSILESVQEVTDFVQIQALHPDFRTLSFLRNLKVIHGRNLDRAGASLQIFKTSLDILELESLKEIRFGRIYIGNNSRLCYADGINWDKIKTKTEQRIIIEHNRNASLCANDNEVCSTDCTEDGCWGPLNNQCLFCKHFRLDKECLRTCESKEGTYTSGPQECQKCHPECMAGCIGPGSDKCNRCRNSADGPYCVSECPATKYRDENNVCQLCHENCDEGCTGPKNTVGPGGCNSCQLVVFGEDRRNVLECLSEESECSEKFYKQIISNHDTYPLLVGKKGCMKCHPECATCDGYGVSFCTSCLHYAQEDKCVSDCSSDHFLDAFGSECLRCDSRCLGCTGSTSTNCVHCKLYKVYVDYDNRDINPAFNCTEKCPASAPHVITDENEFESICIAEDSQAKRRNVIIVIVAAVSFCFVTVIVTVSAILCQQRVKTNRRIRKMTTRMEVMGNDEAEPLQPSNVGPDMSKLHIVNESELEYGKIVLGSGAFGTVYKGMWACPGKASILVAIKVLQECSSSQGKGFLDEARIMTSIDHPCCVRIFGICMSARMMLLTQLMPLGCLLDFIRRNKHNIGSTTLLNWCTQIAEGMHHLEMHGIVHCDLAARNVLVESFQQVKITDFGLAKMLVNGEKDFQRQGGKMPIKWVALESMKTRIFTHKSDVWSFGVTLWELFTFGKRPYENLHIKDIHFMLEKGERLQKPEICNFDTYMLVMVNCWKDDPVERPTFKELADVLSDMAKNPAIHFNIPNDTRLLLEAERISEEYLEPLNKKSLSTSLRYTRQPIHETPKNRNSVEETVFQDVVQNKSTQDPRYYDLLTPSSNLTDNQKVTRSRSRSSGVGRDIIPSSCDSSKYIDLLLEVVSNESDDSAVSGLGSDNIPMSPLRSKCDVVNNPEYFDDTCHDTKTQIPTGSSGNMSRPRTDSVDCGTETEDSEEHEYYNFYTAPPLDTIRLS